MRSAPRKRVLLAYSSLALATFALAADLVKPNIKPGLWEVTTNPHLSGDMPISEDQLAKMTPERRARVEAAMRASMSSANNPHTYKECMTPEKISRGFGIDKGEDPSCKRKIISSTGNELQLHDECDNSGSKTVSDVHFQIKGGTEMTGTINVAMSSGTKTTTVVSTVQGKWLGASCGSVKDTEVEK